MYKFLFHVVAYILTLFLGVTIGSSVMLKLWADSDEEKRKAGTDKTDTAS